MFTILESCPPINIGFVVHIPNSFSLPAGLQTPFLNIVFDSDTNERFLVKGEVKCEALQHTTTYGIVYKGNPTLSLAHYIQHNVDFNKLALTKFLIRYYSKDYSHIRDVNKAIPLVKWVEYAESLYSIYCGLNWTEINTCKLEQYSNLLYNLTQIEKSGLKIDSKVFGDHFEDARVYDGMVYSKYNPYTITGRPSNAYNRVNFAALPKEDGSRSAFISRFPLGKLVEIDFRSYHVHLVANLLEYKFEHDDIHTYFGEYYFNTKNLTEAQYEQSKTRTFKSLYSNDRPDHPFFNGIRALADLLFQEYTDSGYITSPILHRRIKNIADPNPNKVFNYFMQCYETERNSLVLQEVLDLLEGFTSKVILYTYDSILLDFNMEDGRELLNNLLDTLEKGSYPFSVKVGKNYGNMQAIKQG